MNIIIAGCGKIGSTILESLVQEGHNITALDRDEEVINQITNVYDVMGICGKCTDCEVLTEANIEHTSVFVAATGSDELNMLSCYLAKKMGARHTIARIRKPEYNHNNLAFLREQLDLSMAINPELLAAQEMYNILKFPSAAKIETFSRRDFEMLEIKLKPDSELDGLSLWEMREKYAAKVLVAAVQREDEVFIPDGKFVLRSGDKVGLIASPTEIQKFFKALNVYQKQARDVLIVGGSRTAFYLTKMLLNGGSNVKVIELEQKTAEWFETELPKADMVCGDGARQELLMEEGIKETDAFVALTGMDEQNILLSVFASTIDVPKVIAKINRDELLDMAERMGLDTVITPRKIIADVMVRYVRALHNSLGSNVEILYNLMDGKAEAAEFRVTSDFKSVNIPLKELHFRKNILIAGIVRQRKPIIPAGNDVILPGDRVIVLAADQRLNDLADIFAKG